MDSQLLPAFFTTLAVVGILFVILGIFVSARAIQFAAGRMGLPLSTRPRMLIAGLLCAVAMVALVLAWSDSWDSIGLVLIAATLAAVALIHLDISYGAQSFVLLITGLFTFGATAAVGWAAIRIVLLSW